MKNKKLMKTCKINKFRMNHKWKFELITTQIA